MPAEIQGALQALIRYHWEEEAKDFVENCAWVDEDPEANRREGHIFTPLARLQAWLDHHSLEDPAVLRRWLERYTDPEWVPVAPGKRPRPGVAYGCEDPDCADCYEPV